MDLSAWLLDAHADLYERLSNQVVAIVPRDRWCEQADRGGSSIAWILFHLARHHDLALTTAIRNHPPLFAERRDSLGLADAGAGAGLSEHEDTVVSAALDLDVLTQYVDDVFAASRTWMQRVSAMAFESIPETDRRLEHLAGLDRDGFGWLFRMWGGRTVNWFVQWPILGHGHSHVGEAISVRNRMGLSPF